MRKLLAAAVVVIALFVVLLYQIRSPVDAAPTSARLSPPVLAVAAQPAPIVRPPPPPVASPPAADDDGKVNPNSDEFFERFIEHQPRVASRAAMSCYRGGHTMNQWITFTFVGHIKNGEVTFSDVKTKESRLDDKDLEDCMLAAVAKTHWHDDSLPDVDHYEDSATLNPERGGKKYLHDSKNDDAPLAPSNTPR